MRAALLQNFGLSCRGFAFAFDFCVRLRGRRDLMQKSEKPSVFIWGEAFQGRFLKINLLN